MSFLYFLEGLRNPVLDTFFSIVTHLGEETFFILLGLIFFWCVNKKQGYYLLSIGFIGTALNQLLKLVFRIPRPWVKDNNFTIVESARAEATGYSFPSGHTQSSVGGFGGIARWNKNKAVRIICIIICVLVPVSRMYLGVHTPLDVLVSVGISLILIFGLYPLIEKCFECKWAMRILFSAMVLLSLGLLLFAQFYNFPNDIDTVNLASGRENAFKMLGCTLGIFIAYEIDDRFIKFTTDATFLAQIIKLVTGLIPLLLIKEGLKAPLKDCLGAGLGDALRYLLIVIFAGCVWPLTFKYFKKLFKKDI